MERCACGQFRLSAAVACDACLRRMLYGRLVETAKTTLYGHLPFSFRQRAYFDALDAVAAMMTFTARQRRLARDERNELLQETARESAAAYREGRYRYD